MLKITMMLGSFDKLLGESNVAQAIDVARIGRMNDETTNTRNRFNAVQNRLRLLVGRRLWWEIHAGQDGFEFGFVADGVEQPRGLQVCKTWIV